MTTTFFTATKGRVQAGESGVMGFPREIRGATKFPIVFCHGAGGSWDQYMGNPSWLILSKLNEKAVRSGIPTIAEHLGGDTFGNSVGQSRVLGALTAISTYSGCSASKAHLVGTSMGAAVALVTAQLNPAKVASITCMIPLTSILNAAKKNPTVAEANTAGNFPSVISTAWGTNYRTVTDAVTNGTTTLTSATAAFVAGVDEGRFLVSKAANGIPAGTYIVSVTNATTVVMSAAASTTGAARIVGIMQPLPGDADILANASDLSGIPIRMYYAPDDTLIDPADVNALAAAIGPNATSTATFGGGHTNVGLLPLAFDYDEWIAWLKTNGA